MIDRYVDSQLVRFPRFSLEPDAASDRRSISLASVRASGGTSMGGGGPVDFCILDMVKKLVTITNDESVYELSTVIVAAFFTGK